MLAPWGHDQEYQPPRPACSTSAPRVKDMRMQPNAWAWGGCCTWPPLYISICPLGATHMAGCPSYAGGICWFVTD